MQTCRSISPLSVLGLSIALFLTCAHSGNAQVDRSSLSGTVTDPAGKLLPGTRVTAVMPATGLTRDTTSTTNGTYSLPDLPIGDYIVTFEHQGFASIQFDNVVQTVDNTQTLNANLRVSGGVERVEVAADAEIINRNTAEVTGLIERKQAEELPLNGRNWSSLGAATSVRFVLREGALMTATSPMMGWTKPASSTKRSAPGCACLFL
jgi:hypothetical protein